MDILFCSDSKVKFDRQISCRRIMRGFIVKISWVSPTHTGYCKHCDTTISEKNTPWIYIEWTILIQINRNVSNGFHYKCHYGLSALPLKPLDHSVMLCVLGPIPVGFNGLLVFIHQIKSHQQNPVEIPFTVSITIPIITTHFYWLSFSRYHSHFWASFRVTSVHTNTRKKPKNAS